MEGDQVGKGEVSHNNEPRIYMKAEELLLHGHLILWKQARSSSVWHYR